MIKTKVLKLTYLEKQKSFHIILMRHPFAQHNPLGHFVAQAKQLFFQFYET